MKPFLLGGNMKGIRSQIFIISWNCLFVLTFMNAAFADIPTGPEDFEKVPLENPRVNRVLQEEHDEIYIGSPERVKELGFVEIQDLYKSVIVNPVTTLQRIRRYDPTGEIGFCFGRAMGAALIARAMGLERGSIRKLFIVGDLKSSSSASTEWRFHVTMIVRGADANGNLTWYAIDPMMYWGGDFNPLTVDQWIERVRKYWDSWSGHSKAHLYLTEESTAILPDLRDIMSGEPGERIIDLEFDPADETLGLHQASIEDHLEYGITQEQESDPNKFRFYILNKEQQDRYFQTTNEKENDRFNFLGLHIKDLKYYSYYGYFLEFFPTASHALVSNREGDPMRPLRLSMEEGHESFYESYFASTGFFGGFRLP